MFPEGVFSHGPAPIVLSLVLGSMFEEALRRFLLWSKGCPVIFLTRQISAVLIIIALFPPVSPLIFRKHSRLTGGEG